ncbi:MAG: AAA family ATPase [Thermoproteota archaeon]
MVITISGPHGAGKSTYARHIASKLGLRHVSAGMLFRKAASEKGLSLKELSGICETDAGIDKAIDDRTVELMKEGNVLVDAQLSGHLARGIDSFKIYLTAPLQVRVERIAKRDGKDVREIMEETLSREASERRRFKEFYGFDIDDLSIYDLVYNTALMPLESNLSVLERASREYVRSRR